MTSSAFARRAVSVSTGALALCLLSGGAAFADTSGLPPLPAPLPSPSPLPSVPGVPSPDNVVTTVDQTVTQVTSTQPTTSPPSSGGPTAAQPPATTKQPTAGRTLSKPAAKPAVAPPAQTPAQSTAAMPSWSSRVAWDSVTPTDIALPPATGISAVAGTAPAVAPLLMPQSTQRVTPAAALAELDKHSGSPLRAILLTLALAAAAGVGYGHLRVVRG